MQDHTFGGTWHGPRPDKRVEWRGSSLQDLRAFPEDARRSAGFQLELVQRNREPADWKAMPGVGTGAIEIRVHADTEHRVIVITKFEEALYVLHAFQKKSQKTPQRDINLAKKRYRDLIAERQRQRT